MIKNNLLNGNNDIEYFLHSSSRFIEDLNHQKMEILRVNETAN